MAAVTTLMTTGGFRVLAARGRGPPFRAPPGIHRLRRHGRRDQARHPCHRTGLHGRALPRRTGRTGRKPAGPLQATAALYLPVQPAALGQWQARPPRTGPHPEGSDMIKLDIIRRSDLPVVLHSAGAISPAALEQRARPTPSPLELAPVPAQPRDACGPGHGPPRLSRAEIRRHDRRPAGLCPGFLERGRWPRV